MNRIGALFVLAAGILSSAACAQSSPPDSQASPSPQPTASQSSAAGAEAAACLYAKTLDDLTRALDDAFSERQIKVKAESFAHIAHLWSTYEIRPTPDGKATVRGINGIQALFDGTRWKVSQIVWQPQTPTETIPGQYLP